MGHEDGQPQHIKCAVAEPVAEPADRRHQHGSRNDVGSDDPLGLLEIKSKDSHDLGQCNLHCRLTHAHQKAAHHHGGGNPPAMGRSGWIEQPSRA